MVTCYCKQILKTKLKFNFSEYFLTKKTNWNWNKYKYEITVQTQKSNKND